MQGRTAITVIKKTLQLIYETATEFIKGSTFIYLIAFMFNTNYIREYRDFMIWFKANYPRFRQSYSLNITVPVDFKGVGVSMVNIDKTVYNMFFEIENEYYMQTG